MIHFLSDNSGVTAKVKPTSMEAKYNFEELKVKTKVKPDDNR